MPGQKITAIIPAGEEVHQIREAIASVKWADEILVVVDSASHDGTAAAAATSGPGVSVLTHEYAYSAAQKNWAIPRASHGWIFLMDADERVTPELREEIQTLLRSGPDKDAYWIYRRNIFLGQTMRYGGQQTDKVVRLFRRDCRYQDREVHAEIEGYRTVGTLAGKLEHHTFRGWEHYLRKLDRYTTWGAQQDFKDGRSSGFVNVVLRPFHRFLKQYLFRLGFLDGIPGAVTAYLGAYGVFLKYAKLWDLRRGGGGESADRPFP